MYDRSYAEGKFKDPNCKHKRDGIYDSRWYKNGAPKAFKGVCLCCGKISAWTKAKVNLNCEFTFVF